jgi:FAD/FMN-containing dehydrogenase
MQIPAIVMTTTWDTPEDDDRVREFNKDVTAKLVSQLRAKGLYYPYTYINDAGGDQEIYHFYGGGNSLPRMRGIRRKYDPDGVFQNLLSSGFHLGN